MQQIPGHIYDFPQYYDLIYGSDWKAEYDFLQDCFSCHSQSLVKKRGVKRILEPACGTGRLLYRFAKAGYEVDGVDLNSQAIDYCNARFARFGIKNRTKVANMADFLVKPQADVAFNMVSSFRHLTTNDLAVDHFRCMAKSLKRGGIYVLGMHLTPTVGDPNAGEESWAARRGHLSVLSRMWTQSLDLKKRQEIVGMTFDIYTPTKQFRIVDECQFRTYTAQQFSNLLKKIPEFEIAATYNFEYDIEKPIEIDPQTHDVVYVLRKK